MMDENFDLYDVLDHKWHSVIPDDLLPSPSTVIHSVIDVTDFPWNVDKSVLSFGVLKSLDSESLSSVINEIDVEKIDGEITLHCLFLYGKDSVLTLKKYRDFVQGINLPEDWYFAPYIIEYEPQSGYCESWVIYVLQFSTLR